jgi:hypothetical protein
MAVKVIVSDTDNIQHLLIGLNREDVEARLICAMITARLPFEGRATSQRHSQSR